MLFVRWSITLFLHFGADLKFMVARVLLLVLMDLRFFAYCLLNLCERYTTLVKVKPIKTIIILNTNITTNRINGKITIFKSCQF